MKLFCFILVTNIFFQANAYCVFNQSPNKLLINVHKSLYAFGYRVPIKVKKPILSGNHVCCHWQNSDCFVHHSFNGEQEWTNRVVPVACSKYNKIFTKVETPRGGYLVVKNSIGPFLDNWIEVYGFNNTKLDFGYLCGSKNAKYYLN